MNVNNDRLAWWKAALRFESPFYLNMFFLYMALSLLGKGYAAYPYMLLWLWAGYGLSKARYRRLLTEAVRGRHHLGWIGGLAVLYGVINAASTLVNQGRPDAWDGWERVFAWIFCGVVGVWLADLQPTVMIYRHFSRWQAGMLLCLSAVVVGSSLGLFPYVQLGVLDFKTKVDTIFEMLCLSVYVNVFASANLPKRDRGLQGTALLCGMLGFAIGVTSRLMIPVMGFGVILAAWNGRNHVLRWMPLVFAVLGLAALALRPEMIRPLAGINLADPIYWQVKILNYRDIVWQLSLVMFVNHLWLGIGPGNFAAVGEATRQVIGLVDPSRQRYLHAHNLWWNPFVVCGLFGGVVHTLLMIAVVRMALGKLAWERTRPLALNLLMIWFVYQFYGLVEMAPTMEEIIPYVWGATGLLAGMKGKG